MWRKEIFYTLLVGIWIGRALWKQFQHSLKIKGRTSISGYIPKANEISVLKSYLHPHMQCKIIHNSQDMKTT